MSPRDHSDRRRRAVHCGDNRSQGDEAARETRHSGDASASDESYKDEKRTAFNGKCLAIVQSTGEPGEIEILATSEGLDDASWKVQFSP